MILSVMAHKVGTYWKMHFKEFGKERPIRRRKKIEKLVYEHCIIGK